MGDNKLFPTFPTPVILYNFGQESHDLNISLVKDILKESDNTITIPMNSDSRSINLANAVSIVAYEYLRQNYEK